MFGFFITYALFKGEDLSGVGFAVGFASPWLAASFGVVAGILIGIIAEYYTSYDYKPTRNIAAASEEGAALTITQGIGVGMKSCMAPLSCTWCSNSCFLLYIRNVWCCNGCCWNVEFCKRNCFC